MPMRPLFRARWTVANVITEIQNELEVEKRGKYSVGLRAGNENGVSGSKGEMAGNGVKWRERNNSQTKA